MNSFNSDQDMMKISTFEINVLDFPGEMWYHYGKVQNYSTQYNHVVYQNTEY